MSHLEDYVRGLVDTFPPLTDVQRNRIAALLRPAITKEETGAHRSPRTVPGPRGLG